MDVVVDRNTKDNITDDVMKMVDKFKVNESQAVGHVRDGRTKVKKIPTAKDGFKYWFEFPGFLAVSSPYGNVISYWNLLTKRLDVLTEDEYELLKLHIKETVIRGEVLIPSSQPMAGESEGTKSYPTTVPWADSDTYDEARDTSSSVMTATTLMMRTARASPSGDRSGSRFWMPSLTTLTCLLLVCLLGVGGASASSSTTTACTGWDQVLINCKLWGAGGGRGWHPSKPVLGGAGGFIEGHICLKHSEQLTLVVGGAGGDFRNEESCNNGGQPNGGCSALGGAGGGSSHVMLRSLVVLGAGGGGGGGNWAGGGGGGTCNGIVGKGAQAVRGSACNSAGNDARHGGGGRGANESPCNTATQGTCGAGAGGPAGQPGHHSNGAGGQERDGGAYGAGGGGAASWLLALNHTVINADSSSAVGLNYLPSAYTSTPGATSTDGAIIIENAATGEVLAAHFEHGTYQFQAPVSFIELMDQYMQKYLLAALDCERAGNNYNITTKTCDGSVGSASSTGPPPSGLPQASNKAFVGLDAHGNLIINSAANHSVFVNGYVVGTTNAKEIQQLTAQMQTAYAAVGIGIYSFGGMLGAQNTNYGFRYNPIDHSVTQVASIPNPRHGAFGARVGKHLHVFGGSPTERDHHVYSPTLDAWSVSVSQPTVRHYGAAVAAGNIIFVLGGVTVGGDTGTIHSFDTSSETWNTQLASMDYPRRALSAVVHNNSIFAVGGHTFEAYSPPFIYSNIVEQFDLQSMAWSSLPNLPAATVTSRPCAVSVGNFVYVLPGGHRNSTTLVQVSRYSGASNSWSKVSSTLPLGDCAGVVALDNSTLVADYGRKYVLYFLNNNSFSQPVNKPSFAGENTAVVGFV
eukprot:m.29046 g.29046  ORF g.29046 m.29046 type:complete len:858 (-) comp14266_c0_seq1:214-2787(-)